MKKFTLLFLIFLISSEASAALDVAEIKLELAKLEGQKDKNIGLTKCEELMSKITAEENISKSSAEVFTWKGIVLAKMAHYKRSPALAKEARDYLEKAVNIDEKNSNAAALNALGILYYRVPRIISFGDHAKSEEYFKRAIQISSNLDTNWRYGEFLVENGKKDEGLILLNTALKKVNKKHPDEIVKEKIIKELIKKYE